MHDTNIQKINLLHTNFKEMAYEWIDSYDKEHQTIYASKTNSSSKKYLVMLGSIKFQKRVMVISISSFYGK